MAKKNVKGHEGLLSVYDTTTSAYLPIVCLTSTSLSRATETIEKVNYCTQGDTVTTVSSITRELSIDGEIMTDLTAEASYADLIDIIESKGKRTWRLEGRDEAPQYFTGSLTSLSDTFGAGEDATFSGSLSIDEALASVDPNPITDPEP